MRKPLTSVRALCAGAMLLSGATSAVAQTYRYDALGRLLVVEDATSTTYSHDAADNRTNRTVEGAGNTWPIATADSINPRQNTAVTFDPRGNDRDSDGDALTITSRTVPAHGTATIVSGGQQITYTPTTGYLGSDSFNYTISDGRGGTASATVSVSVISGSPPANSAPVALDDSVSTAPGVAFSFDPRGNDVDADGDPLAITSVTVPANGSAVISPGMDSITYAPAPGYTGPDSLTYTVSDGRGGSDTTTVAITVANPPAGTPSISISGPGAKSEGNSGSTLFAFAVTRAGSTAVTSFVDFYTWPLDGASGRPTGADFAGGNEGTLVFSPGETTKVIGVLVAGDTAVEPDETFNVSLSNAREATIANPTGTATIVNDDSGAPAPGATVSIGGGGSLSEGNSGTTTFSFTVTRTGTTSLTSMVDYWTWPTWSESGATDAADFSGQTSSTVTFNAGETTKIINVSVAGDTTVEPNELFNVSLSNPRDATIGTGTGTATVLNDDGAAPPATTVAIANAGSITEGNSGTKVFSFTVTRTGPTTTSSMVDYEVWPTDGTTGRPSAADFSGALAGTVSFNPGETSKSISVLVVGDTAAEPDEAFNVGLSNPRGTVLGNTNGTATILNDDAGAPPTGAKVSIGTAGSKMEGASGATVFEFPVTRTGDTSLLSMVDYWTWPTWSGSGQTDAGDFTGATSGTVYFYPGETTKLIQVSVVGDTVVEANETFTVSLSNPRDTTIVTIDGTATILNDDN